MCTYIQHVYKLIYRRCIYIYIILYYIDIYYNCPNFILPFLAIIQCTIVISEQVCMYWNLSWYFQYPFHQF